MGRSWTRRQYLILTFFFIINVFCASIYTVQSPFYPREAESKGATSTEYSIVFGVYEATIVIACPLWSTLAHYTGIKIALFSGVLVQGLSALSFGFVEFIGPLGMFLGISIVIRIIEGFSFGACFIGVYTFIPIEFPNDVPYIMGILETAMAVGFSIGPPIGGVFYNIGGFFLPFAVYGAFFIVLAALVPFFIWRTKVPPPTESLSVFTILKHPVISTNFFILLGPACVFGFIYAILEPFLRNSFNSSAITSGLVFGLSGLFYSIPTPFIGYLTGKIEPVYLIVIGLVLDIIGNLLIGPLPVFGGMPNFTCTCIGVCLFALGTGMAVISCFVNASIETKNLKLADESKGMSLVSGCFMAFFATGVTAGAPIAGSLYDNFGFRSAEYFPVGLLLVLLVLEIIYIFKFKFMKSKMEFDEPGRENVNETSRLLSQS